MIWYLNKMGKFGKKDMHTGTPCEGEGRNCVDIYISQGIPSIARKPPEARERHEIGYSSSEGANPDDTLISYL